MAENIAILAGHGQLPLDIACACPGAMFISFTESSGSDIPQGRHFRARLERFGELFEVMGQAGISKVIFAGSLSRPQLDPAGFDEGSVRLWPRLKAALGRGDDALLREVIAIFETEGFEVVGAAEVAPELVAAPKMSQGRAMNADEEADAARGLEVLRAISPLDLAQAIVVEGGQVLGLETIQGTDAMLKFVAQTPQLLRRSRGVFVKAAKRGQDMRVDMPTIGPETIRNVAAAGLAGVVIPAGKVLVLEQDEVARLIDQLDLFLVVR